MFAGYEIPSFIYDIRGYFILRLTYRNTLRLQLKFFKKNISNNHLEACIGNGTFAKFYLKKTSSFTGIDASPKSIQAAQKKFPEANLITSYIEHLDSDERFDSINLPNSFHTIASIYEGFAVLVKHLSEDGIFSFNVLLYPTQKISKMVNEYGQRTGILHRPYEIHEIDELIEKHHLETVEKFVKGNCAYYRVKKATP